MTILDNCNRKIQNLHLYKNIHHLIGINVKFILVKQKVNKISAAELISLKDQFPDNFDYLMSNDDSNGQLVIQYYNFNLYTSEHYKCISEFVSW